MDGPTSRATVALTRLIAALALVLVGTGAGCSAQAPAPMVDGSDSSSGPLKQGTGAVRHDLEPLTRRFSALGTPVSATWMSGSLASGAPGPSTYWIDAVVEVAPATARALAELAPTAAAGTPEAERPVLDAVPEGSSKLRRRWTLPLRRAVSGPGSGWWRGRTPWFSSLAASSAMSRRSRPVIGHLP